jgi:hypothetical protein
VGRHLRFLIGFLGALAASFAGLAVLFLALDHAGRLKAPAFAGRASFDEKLRHLRRAGGLPEAEVVLVGSSTTLQGVDGRVLGEALGVDDSVLNGGVQGIGVGEGRFLLDFLLERGGARHVAMITTTVDFERCEPARAAFFDQGRVAAYVAGRSSEILMQFRHLDLWAVLREARRIHLMRERRDLFGSFSFDSFGSLLIHPSPDSLPELAVAGLPIRIDPRCYDELRRIALDLRARGIAFTHVLAPLRPAFLERHDPDGALLALHRAALARALDGTGALALDADRDLALGEAAFYDAYHLTPEAVVPLSRYLGEAIAAWQDRPAPLATGAVSGGTGRAAPP